MPWDLVSLEAWTLKEGGDVWGPCIRNIRERNKIWAVVLTLSFELSLDVGLCYLLQLNLE